MNKLLMILVLMTTASTSLANEMVKPVNALFDAMRNHDSQKILAQFTETALLQRALPGGDIQQTDIKKFAAGIGQSTRSLDEHLLSIKIHQQDNLASVWTPYAFYLDSKLSHCGVNSFQLVKTADGWKIHYLIDNSHPGDCQQFISAHNGL